MKKIGFIGAGKIGGAIMTGLLKSESYSRRDIYVYDKDELKLQNFADQGFSVCADEAEVVKHANYVFVCVRQPDLKDLLAKVKPVISSANVIITVIAGVSIGYFKKNLGNESKIVRVMPNTPMMIGKGATALAYDLPVTYVELQEVKSIIGTTGIVEVLPEDRMNEVISVNSSSPVYLYKLIRAMINGAVAQGIDEDTARHLVMTAVEGSLELVKSSEKTIDEMISDVCTPNGTTAQAVSVLDKNNYERIVGDAMLACTKRAYALEKETNEAK